jgi:hypothetical protein
MARTLTTCTICGAHADPDLHADWHRQVRMVDPSFLAEPAGARLMPPDPPELVDATKRLDAALAEELQARDKWSPAAAEARRLGSQLLAKYRGHPLGYERAVSRQERRDLDKATAADRRLGEEYRAAAERTTQARQAHAQAQQVATLAAIEAWKEPTE